MSKMKISAKGLGIIKQHEGLRLTGYLPTPQDVPTIGYGHTKTAKLGMTITEKQAEDLLRSDIAWAEAAVNNSVVVPLNQNQFDALVSFVFNVGATAFNKSTMLRKLNQSDYEAAANEFKKWNKQKGRVLAGLTRRRAEEAELFRTPTRKYVAQSTTVQASAAQLLSGTGAGIGAVAALDGTAQIVALGIAAVVIVAALWVMRERIKKWSKGVR